MLSKCGLLVRVFRRKSVHVKRTAVWFRLHPSKREQFVMLQLQDLGTLLSLTLCNRTVTSSKSKKKRNKELKLKCCGWMLRERCRNKCLEISTTEETKRRVQQNSSPVMIQTVKGLSISHWIMSCTQFFTGTNKTILMWLYMIKNILYIVCVVSNICMMHDFTLIARRPPILCLFIAYTSKPS